MSETEEKVLYRALDYCENAAVESFIYETQEMKIIITQQIKNKPISTNEVEQTDQEIKQNKEILKKDDIKIIYSEMNGIFYYSSDPKKPPLISVGDRIEVGDVIGIVEVMKCFIEVKAEITGVLEEVLVPNEVMIEHGQPLFRIRSESE